MHTSKRDTAPNPSYLTLQSIDPTRLAQFLHDSRSVHDVTSRPPGWKLITPHSSSRTQTKLLHISRRLEIATPSSCLHFCPFFCLHPLFKVTQRPPYTPFASPTPTAMSGPLSRLQKLASHLLPSSPAADEYAGQHHVHQLSPTFFLPRAAAIEPDVSPTDASVAVLN